MSENQSPKVSVIVPVYNAGSFFRQCLDSLVHQTLQEIEIILILDCPTDGSDEIAASYASRYPSIKIVYNETNMHIGISRNRGLEVAKGEYIGFCDHDDFVELNMFKEMFTLAKGKNLDVLLTNVNLLSQNHPFNPSGIKHTTLREGSAFTQDFFMKLFSIQSSSSNRVIYSHLYRKDFLQRHNIKFPDTRYTSGEDVLFNTQVYSCLLENNGKFAYLPKSYYNHILHQTNTGGTIAYKELNKSISLLEGIASIITTNKNIPHEVLMEAYTQRMICILYNSWRCELKYRGGKAFRNLNLIKKNPVLRNIVKNYNKIYDSQLTIPKNCFAIMLKIYCLK